MTYDLLLSPKDSDITQLSSEKILYTGDGDGGGLNENVPHRFKAFGHIVCGTV